MPTEPPAPAPAPKSPLANGPPKSTILGAFEYQPIRIIPVVRNCALTRYSHRLPTVGVVVGISDLAERLRARQLLFLVGCRVICRPYSYLAKQPVNWKRDQSFFSWRRVVRVEVLEAVCHEHHVLIERGVSRSGIIVPLPARDGHTPVTLKPHLLHKGSVGIERQGLFGELIVRDVPPIQGSRLLRLTPKEGNSRVAARKNGSDANDTRNHRH